MIVSSETLPSRAPTRPALSTAGGKSEACDLSSWSAFSSAFFPSSGASANNSRNCWTFFSTDWSCCGRCLYWRFQCGGGGHVRLLFDVGEP